MSRNSSIIAALTVASALLCFPAARAVETSLPKGCPVTKDKPTGYLIGSSTMGSVMGPMIKGMLKRRWGISSRHWGKASSGLARPDFHDWPKKAKGLMKRYRPDFVIVSLGTNDNQAVKTRRGWIRPKRKKAWEDAYVKRIRSMLETLGGPDGQRPVIWLGPTAFEGRTANVMGPRIHAIMKREVEAFDGNAVYVDVYSKTRKANGKLVMNFKAPDTGKVERARGHDGIHFTARAVKFLMAEPALGALSPCFDAKLAQWKADKERSDAERRAKADERRAQKKLAKEKRRAERIEARRKRLETRALRRKARGKVTTEPTVAKKTPKDPREATEKPAADAPSKAPGDDVGLAPAAAKPSGAELKPSDAKLKPSDAIEKRSELARETKPKEASGERDQAPPVKPSEPAKAVKTAPTQTEK